MAKEPQCDRSYTSDLASRSGLFDILQHCYFFIFFLNVAALLHCPLGSAAICGTIVMLPVADISTGWILQLHSPSITHWSTALVGLHHHSTHASLLLQQTRN